ncbi:post-GPI attachment to proteins factor 4-like isoform X2 [Mya arenaria]|uniref:post-GPI attachment to proteins factor 4-like isoform X2 n=1 Tax=Mya arenaria TaxID=6604 RepID=UPI0022E3BC13|nr:post-GPI attachment to proteins factor 4-like isoform X2 [Mya arenaria]
MVKLLSPCMLTRCSRKGIYVLLCVLLYGITFLVLAPLACISFKHVGLDVICFRNKAAGNARLIAQNQARLNRSLVTLREYSRIDSYCRMFPATCRRKNAQIADGEEKTAERDLQNVSIGMQLIRKTFAGGLAISFVTTRRRSNITGYRGQYLSQSVAKMLNIINHGDRLTNDVPIYFSICNVDPRLEVNPEISNLPKWIPVHKRFDGRRKLSIEDARSSYEKAKNDYVFCLEHTLQTNASYILLMEDDALAMDNLFHVLSHFIFSLRKLSSDETHVPLLDKLTYLKLFYPVHLSGYFNVDPERVPELISVALVLTALTLCAVTFCQPSLRVSPTFVKIAFVFFLLVVVIIGRYNIIELRSVSDRLFYLTPAPRGSAVAVLYPRQGALDIARYLPLYRCDKRLPKDLAMGEIVIKHGLDARLVQPNLFEHIGHYSSVHQKLRNPFAT